MNFILKIVEGPNKGAEIALVEGVAVTLGKGDDCDIVLADPTMPDAPQTVEASADAVSVDGSTLEPFTVKTVGATAYAVGPADAPWGELKWERRTGNGERGTDEVHETKDEWREEAPSNVPSPAADGDGKPGKKRGGCFGCLVVLVLLLLALGCLAWHYRHLRKPARDFYEARISRYVAKAANMFEEKIGARVETAEKRPPVTLREIAACHGLDLEEGSGVAKLSGNFTTRAARLRATAEAYGARPGVELDLSDDESFRAAAEDALFTLTEGALKVVSATNRVLSICGVARSPEALKRTLVALDTDLPKLRAVNAAAVSFGAVPKRAVEAEEREEIPIASSRLARHQPKKRAAHVFPVCGILTKPYPCLVMRDGTRVLEGASLGDDVVLKIEADAVTVTNSTGRFTWRP